MFSDTLTLTGATTNNSGNYTVVVTNTAGTITSTVSTVTIAMPPPLATAVVSPGSFQINANTITDLNYVVLMATNLAAPIWTPVLTNNTGLTGVINLQTNTAGGPNQFYRLMFP